MKRTWIQRRRVRIDHDHVTCKNMQIKFVYYQEYVPGIYIVLKNHNYIILKSGGAPFCDVEGLCNAEGLSHHTIALLQVK